jgi:hypothetical protein
LSALAVLVLHQWLTLLKGATQHTQGFLQKAGHLVPAGRLQEEPQVLVQELVVLETTFLLVLTLAEWALRFFTLLGETVD